MVKTEQIQELLYMSPQSYGEMYQDLFFKWCENLSRNDKTGLLFQKYIANTAISKWYLANFDDLEKQFIEMTAPNHSKLHYKVARQIYHEVVSEMLRQFPGALLEAAEKLNIINNLN